MVVVVVVVVAWMKKYWSEMKMKDRKECLEDHCLKASRIALHPTKVEKDRLSHQATVLGIGSCI